MTSNTLIPNIDWTGASNLNTFWKHNLLYVEIFSEQR